MTSEAFDVLIMGGGNAGFGVTVPTRQAGLKVALVEERDLGGTCPSRGCTPKKVPRTNPQRRTHAVTRISW
ncbi:MAG: FAD-dependent oxidoreductase [Methyloceanibacter sp.]|jgi:glutathione reductase (NADPH)